MLAGSDLIDWKEPLAPLLALKMLLPLLLLVGELLDVLLIRPLSVLLLLLLSFLEGVLAGVVLVFFGVVAVLSLLLLVVVVV